MANAANPCPRSSDEILERSPDCRAVAVLRVLRAIDAIHAGDNGAAFTALAAPGFLLVVHGSTDAIPDLVGTYRGADGFELFAARFGALFETLRAERQDQFSLASCDGRTAIAVTSRLIRARSASASSAARAVSPAVWLAPIVHQFSLNERGLVERLDLSFDLATAAALLAPSSTAPNLGVAVPLLPRRSGRLRAAHRRPIGASFFSRGASQVGAAVGATISFVNATDLPDAAFSFVAGVGGKLVRTDALPSGPYVTAATSFGINVRPKGIPCTSSHCNQAICPTCLGTNVADSDDVAVVDGASYQVTLQPASPPYRLAVVVISAM